MKILMLTAKCGMGHYNCAKAIEEKIKKDFITANVECVDIYEVTLGKTASVFYKIYNLLVNHGNFLYNYAYKKAIVTDDNQTLLKIFSDMMLKDFSRFIEDKKPDMIISTYSFTSELMSIYKEKTGSKIPLVTWITDVKAHNGWVNTNTDVYIIADEITKKDLRKMGVDNSKIKIGGIPVSNDFECKYQKENHYKRQVLVMGGGLGMLPKDMSFYKKLNELEDIEVTIVTGKNKNLYWRLKNKFPNLNVLGYVNNISNLMKNSDILLTKAGGITTFEAIQSETPMIVFKPFLEQEVHNAKYISEKEIGYVLPSETRKSKKNIDLILEILENDQMLIDMKFNIRKIKEELNSNVLDEMIIEESEVKCS